MTASGLLQIHELSAGYGRLPAVRDMDLTVDHGEIVALLGANGAGKTTTLLTIAGILPPLAGTIRFDGHPLTGPQHERARAGIAYVPENRGIFCALTTRENLQLGRGSVDRAVALFAELSGLLDRPAGLLSGGEQQILALARALAGEPRLILVDELSQGLAPMVVDRLLRCLQESSEKGTSVLLVEQQVDRALAVADRACVLDRGQVAFQGRCTHLRSQPEVLRTIFDGLES